MSKAAFITLLAIGLLTMAGCKGTTSRVPNIPGISDEEVFRVISADANLTRCGDRYFQPDASYYLDELKDPTFNFESQELTQADSLNGFTWRGTVSLRATAIRNYYDSGDGGHWADWRGNNDLVYLGELSVKNGRIPPRPQSRVKPVNCSNIPPG